VEKAAIVDIDIEFPLAIEFMNMKRAMLGILGEEAKLFLNFCLNRFWKFPITLTKCFSQFKNYSASHVSASTALANRLVLPFALSFLALCIAS